MLLWCFSCVSDLGMLIDTASTMSNSDLDAMPAQAFERHIEKIENENKELARKLQGRSVLMKNSACLTLSTVLSIGNLGLTTLLFFF